MRDGPVVLAGAGGMLGQAFGRSALADRIVPLGRDDLQVARSGAIRDRLRAIAPAVVINCAADTDVEGAEDDARTAFAVNALLPELLAQACRADGARLLHFSSTGCYGDWKRTPYDDWDALRPTTAHHRSKAAGEAAVRDACPDSLILRLGWLYGGAAGHRKNFVWARINEARGAGEMFSDPSQTGTPTHVDDVVRQSIVLLELAGLPTKLRPRAFRRRAPVSPNEAAVNSKLAMLGLDAMPAWDAALARYVTALGETAR